MLCRLSIWGSSPILGRIYVIFGIWWTRSLSYAPSFLLSLIWCKYVLSSSSTSFKYLKAPPFCLIPTILAALSACNTIIYFAKWFVVKNLSKLHNPIVQFHVIDWIEICFNLSECPIYYTFGFLFGCARLKAEYKNENTRYKT